ncbi:ead/Ea22-like family protein [Enterobacter roggenkampii]|uniref:ead/Ea22-like family protein n=1 Tax=Enterobacter roggenkampii TaxID=1812935 RepID=UPI0011B9F510|nr:ead/Ea22-like family protein [Enterobacter roggenkampii]TWY19413.1 ead/Ea22-like family protein [Enterobacter roggenkampii]
MSNIDKRALREAAEKSSTDNHTQDEWFRFLRCSTPATVLALLDELEAAEKRIAKLEAKLDSADKLQDSAFRHGLQHGFSLGQTDNQAGFEECLSAYGTGKGE